MVTIGTPVYREPTPWVAPVAPSSPAPAAIHPARAQKKWHELVTDAERDAIECALALFVQARDPAKRQRYSSHPDTPYLASTEAMAWGHAVDLLAQIKKK
jgi:hypothetical protein